MYYLNLELGGLYPVAIRLGDVTQNQADGVKRWVEVAAGNNEPLLNAKITASFPHYTCSGNVRNYKKSTLQTISRDADVLNNHTYVLCCDYIENVGKFLEAFENNLAELDVDKKDEICAMITYVYGRAIVSVDYCEALAGKQETLSKGYCPYDATHKLATFTEGDDEQ